MPMNRPFSALVDDVVRASRKPPARRALPPGIRESVAKGAAYLADLETGRIGPADVPLEAIRGSAGCVVLSHDLGAPMAIVGDHLPAKELPPDVIPYTVGELCTLIEGGIGRHALGLVHEIKELFGGRVIDVRDETEDTTTDGGENV